MGSLRAENHKQSMTIESLKETVAQQNKTINQQEATIKELITANRPVSSEAISRRKRPARLLPASIEKEMKLNKKTVSNSMAHRPIAPT